MRIASRTSRSADRCDEVRQVRVAGITAELALVTHRVTGMDFEKWILVFPAEKQTFLCVAAYPSTQKDEFRTQLRDSLLSLSYDPAAPSSAPTFYVDVTDLNGDRMATTTGGEATFGTPGRVVEPPAPPVN